MIRSLKPEFVDAIPKALADGTIYISRKYSTAVHRCCCGCGQKVVTPLRPTDWKLRVSGNAVSLWPSIGNWSFPCRSHYWIVENRVEWSYEMTQEEIDAGRRQDARAKDRFIRTGKVEAPAQDHTEPENLGWWERFKRWLGG